MTTATATATATAPVATATASAAAAAHPAINWFEIPVTDIDRAQAFYEAVLGQPLRREPMGPQTLAVSVATGAVAVAVVMESVLDLRCTSPAC